jgi:hypothetical protein
LTKTTNESVRRQLEDVVAAGVHAYITNYVGEMFPAPRSSQVQEAIVNGIAAALAQVERDLGTPILAALAHELLDKFVKEVA